MLRLRPSLPTLTFRVSSQGSKIATRAYAAASTSYVPPAAKKHILPFREGLPIPSSPTFFSGRSEYLDSLYKLEKEFNKFNFLMRKAHMIPLPKAAQHHVGHIQAYWRDAEGIKQIVGRNVRQTEYRRLITILTQLNRLKRIATLCGNNEIATQIATTVAPYEKPNKSELEALRSTRKKPVPDENGRVYAVGRRKTSSARVWVIKKQPEAYTEASDRGSVPTTECLVNGIPAARYFAQVTERERVFMPFRLTGLLSSYNVFCIVRGGGTTAQSEAISMGISRALQVLEPEVSPILKQSKLLRRDPRMVERKKTGLLKARKARQWVKR